MGSGQPREESPSRISRALASADSCSAFELDTPEARLGSQSIRSQRRARKPAPPDNIRVGGRRIPPSRTQTVHRAGKQIGIDRIDRDVNAAKGEQAFQRLRDGGDVLVIEITGLDMLPPVIGADRVQHTHLEHVPGLKPEAQSMCDFICVGHCVLHDICLQNTVPS